MIESTLSPDGKLALKQLREAQRPQRSSALNVDIPSQVRKKTKLTTETLLAGARMMRAQELGGSKLNATNSCANNG